MKKYGILLIIVLFLGACSYNIERGELSEGLYTNNSLGVFVNFNPALYYVGTLDSKNIIVNYNSIGNNAIDLKNKEEATLVIFKNRKTKTEITLSVIKSNKLPKGDIKKYLYNRVKRNVAEHGYGLKMTSSEIKTININSLEYYNFTSTYIVNQRNYIEKWRYAYLNLDDYILLISVINPVEKHKTPANKVLLDFLSNLNKV